jgi:sn-glycerol 3-phosphate transport system substrate-binding protein
LKKKTMFKMIALIVSMLMLFSACGGTQGPANEKTDVTTSQTGASKGASSESAGSEAKEPTTIEFWHALTAHNGEGLQKIVDDFNTSQNDVKVNAIFQGDYYENAAKLQAALIAGNQPDVIMLEVALVGQFVAADALVNLEDYLTQDEINNFQEGLLVDTYIDGKFAAVPFNRSTPVLYYNKDMLVKAGLDPAGPKTWDELRSFSQTISKKIPGVIGCEIPVDIWFFEAGMFQQGGSVLTEDLKNVAFNNEKGETIIKFWQDMIDEGSMKSPVGKDYNGWDAAMADFVGEKTAMIKVSTAYLKGLLDKTEGKFEIGTTFLPAKEPGKFATPTGGANIAVVSKSSDEKIKASIEFIKFLTNKENVAYFCEWTGYVPTTKENLESPQIKTLYEKFPQYYTAVDQLQYAKKRSITEGYREMAVIIQEELRRVLLDTKIPAKDALDRAAEQIQQILDENK